MVWTKEFRPPNSPDLNPLDDYVWGVFMIFTNQRPHNTKASLKASICEVVDKIKKEVVVRVCSRFRTRIEKMIAAEGGFMEQMSPSQCSVPKIYV